MKRIIISILCGAGLVLGYFIFLVLLYGIFGLSFETLAVLLKPLNLPYDIYKNLVGPYYGSRTVVGVLNTAAAVILYSIPFYLILTIRARLSENASKGLLADPPAPPQFDL